MRVLAKNYEIIKEIGRGGTGSVYLGFDKKLERQIAIKMLELDSNLDKELVEEIVKRFEKEAKAIAKLKHPNIVDIYDFGEEDGKHFMVIELLEGNSLSNQLTRIKKLPLEKIIDIGIQLSSAISYAHSQGIIHRDIKPANVMMIDDDKVKLTDFGIAQLNNDKLGLTQAGSILGSILYIPPEQLVDSHKVDKRADVYSLGVTLFQLFTGRLPFEGNSVAEVVTKILNQNLPSMRDFRAEIPEALDRIILKAIKKEPEDRYQNIEDFAAALVDIKEYLQNTSNLNLSNTLTGKKPEVKPKEQIKQPQQKKKNNTYLLPILLTVLLSGVLAYFFIARNNENKNEKPVTNTKKVIKPTVSAKPVNKPSIKSNQDVKKINTPPVKKSVIVRPVKSSTVNKNVIKPRTQTVVKYNQIKPVIPRKKVSAPVAVNRTTTIRNVSRPVTPKVNKPIITKPVQNKKVVGEGY